MPTLEEDIRAIRGILEFFRVLTVLGIIATVVISIAAVVSYENEQARIRDEELRRLSYPHYP